MNAPISATQEIALTRAIALLNATGLKYAILRPDGEKLGTLEIAPEKTLSARPKVYDWVHLTDYIATLDALQVGGCHTWTLETEELAIKFQGCVSGSAGKKFGNGNSITHRKGSSVEILRVA